jgi:cyanophycinase
MPSPSPRIDRPTASAGGTAGDGTLVLIGGACTPDGHAMAAFVDEARRIGGSIVGVTAASSDPDGSARLWTGDFRSIGVTDVLFPPMGRNGSVADREAAGRIDDAAAVFLGGGDQVKLVAALSGTRACAAMKRLFRRGGVIGGTSAGAAALSALTMAGGEIDTEGHLVEQYIGPGFGLLGFEAIIDTHFSQRRRLQRLFVVIAGNPQLLGLGLDENTALVVRGSLGEVVGAGGVTFVDGRDSVRFDNAGEVEQGRQLTLSHLRVGIVGSRYHLDLARRELHELLSGEPSPFLRRLGGGAP